MLGHIFLHGIMAIIPRSELPAVDVGSGAPPSREHRASVRVEGQGAGIGLDRDGDPYAGPGSRSVGHADDGTGGLQDAGGGCLDGTGGRSVCPGGVAPGALEPGLASTARVVRAHTYPGNRLMLTRR